MITILVIESDARWKITTNPHNSR